MVFYPLQGWTYRLDETERLEMHETSMETTLAFIDQGVKMNMACLFETPTLHYPFSKEWAGAITGLFFSYEVNLSRLAIIELCFRNRLESRGIKQKAEAEGTRYVTRCNKLYIAIGRENEDEAREVNFTLSEAESSAFLEIFEREMPCLEAAQEVQTQLCELGYQIWRDRFTSSTELSAQEVTSDTETTSSSEGRII